MATLQLHSTEVTTVFDLLGKTENDMTYSLGWCLAQVPSFLDSVGTLLGTPNLSAKNVTISLQEYHAGTGITDIEIHAPGHVRWIIEAKRGFTVPSVDQLRRYAEHLDVKRAEDNAAILGLAVLAESDRKNEWLRRQLPADVAGIPVQSLSWRDIKRAAKGAASDASQASKRLLAEFTTYLGLAASMQNQTSNIVYVVSLNHDTFGGETTSVEVVDKHLKYFHPVGGGRGGWPTEPLPFDMMEPCNQSTISRITTSLQISARISRISHRRRSSRTFSITWVHRSGRPNEHRQGAPWRANRVWCFVDTLLTSSTIVEAKAVTDERLRRMEE